MAPNLQLTPIGRPSVSAVLHTDQISLSQLGHTSSQGVQTAINYQRGTLTEEVCQQLEAIEVNLTALIEFWIQPRYKSMACGGAAETICGTCWMLGLNYLFLNQVQLAKVYTLNGAFIHQCSVRPIEQLAELSRSGIQFTPNEEIPLYVLGHLSLRFGSKEHMERYILSVLPYDFLRRNTFAAHVNHAAKSHPQWVQDRVASIGNDWNFHAGSNRISYDACAHFRQRCTLKKEVIEHASGSYQEQQSQHSASPSNLKAYVNCLENEWDSSTCGSHRHAKSGKGQNDTMIEICMQSERSIGHGVVKMSISTSKPLTEMFTKYSEEQDIPLRSLRFTFKGKLLFLSSASKETPEQLGWIDGDVIQVASFSSDATAAASLDISQDSPKSHSKKTKKVKNKCAGKKTRPNAAYVSQDPREAHSEFLSKVFDEADSTFKSIRRRLNNLSLERTLPKEKVAERPVISRPKPVQNPNTDGSGGKAGKASYVIHVGEVNNLYKSSKKSKARIASAKPQMIDLHGCTREEAVQKLDVSLPIWEKRAMEGCYPFVAPVVIVCGGGNQVLSETVSQWIKENKVSNAPNGKKSFALAA